MPTALGSRISVSGSDPPRECHYVDLQELGLTASIPF
jgi:hypothetical protein